MIASSPALRRWSLAGAGAAAVALVAVAVASPDTAGAGWLLAFVAFVTVPAGSLALTLIHALTGGRWGNAIRPVLAAGMAGLPAAAVLFVPVLLAGPTLFPWEVSVDGDVRRLYLDAPLFATRAFVALVGWALLASLIRRRRGEVGVLLAGLATVFYGISVNAVSVRWPRPWRHSPLPRCSPPASPTVAPFATLPH